MKKTPIERINENIKICPDTGCHVWQRYVDEDGYGRIKIDGHIERVHRWIYEFYNGELDPSVHCHHKCFNPSCCNIDHLEAVSAKDNQRENYLNNRCSKVKLPLESIEKIKTEFTSKTKTAKELAREYGCSLSAIYAVNTGLSWSWLEKTS
jgi:hypothetical protein